MTVALSLPAALNKAKPRNSIFSFQQIRILLEIFYYDTQLHRYRGSFGNLVFFYNRGDEFVADPPVAFSVSLEGGIATGGKIKISSIDIKNPVASCGDEGTQNKSIFTIFLLGLLGGLIALITPCVFPMIPVTVTFFTKKSKNKKGALYSRARSLRRV